MKKLVLIFDRSGIAPGLGRQRRRSAGGFAPTAQIGFFQHFGGSDWLWGAKVAYSYLNAHSTDNRVRDPQVGSFTSTTPDTFTGNVVIGSYQSGITHKINFIPFLGHSFARSMVYVGVGPSLSQVKSSLNKCRRLCRHQQPASQHHRRAELFSSTQWVLGGVATIATYYIDRSWFIDMNYTFGVTSATDGYTDTLSGTYYGHIVTQAVAVSINKTF